MSFFRLGRINTSTIQLQMCLFIDLDSFYAILGLKWIKLSAHMSGKGVSHFSSTSMGNSFLVIFFLNRLKMKRSPPKKKMENGLKWFLYFIYYSIFNYLFSSRNCWAYAFSICQILFQLCCFDGDDSFSLFFSFPNSIFNG